jgi:hypothetical protein
MSLVLLGPFTLFAVFVVFMVLLLFQPDLLAGFTLFLVDYNISLTIYGHWWWGVELN